MATDFLVKQGKVMGGVRLVTDADVAHQTDLTNIRETGTTSSQAISSGTYFYLNNVLVRAKADIANGATFTLNTNYEVVTAGALNELASSLASKMPVIKAVESNDASVMVAWLTAHNTEIPIGASIVDFKYATGVCSKAAVAVGRIRFTSYYSSIDNKSSSIVDGTWSAIS